jgi:hypothetical protein
MQMRVTARSDPSVNFNYKREVMKRRYKVTKNLMIFTAARVHNQYKTLSKKGSYEYCINAHRLTQIFSERTFSLKIQSTAAVKAQEDESTYLVYKKESFISKRVFTYT